MNLRLESIRKEIEESNYWTVEYYSVNGNWIKDQSLETAEEAIEIIERYNNNKKYKVNVYVEDMCTRIIVKRYRRAAEIVECMVEGGVFNIHEYIQANETIGLKQVVFCLQQFASLPGGEPPVEITREIDLQKMNWTGLFKKYDSIGITIKSVFDTFLDRTEAYNVQDIEEILENNNIIKIKYHKVDNRVNMTIYDESDVVYASEFKNKTSNKFNELIWAHGLCAYNGGKNPIVCAQGIVNNPQWEICCAKEDELIGPFGIYVKGDVECVSNADLVSMINIFTGQRGMDMKRSERRAKGIIYNPEELQKGIHSHGETILQQAQVVGMWVKDWYLEESMEFKRNMEELDKIKNILGLDKYEIVEETFKHH